MPEIKDSNMSALTPRMKVIRSFGPERTVTLEKFPFKIGRSGENDLQSTDASVSRYHAEVVAENGGFRLVDKGSKCGTFINGERMDSGLLKHNDHIRLGNETELIFLTEEEQITDKQMYTESPSVFLSTAGSDLRNVSKLLETARMFSGKMALGEVLDITLDMAIDVTGAERAFLVLKDEDGEPHYERGRDANKNSLPATEFKISRTTLKQAMESGERVFLTDAHGQQNKITDSMLNLELRTIVCLPLKRFSIFDSQMSYTSAQDVIGALYIDARKATLTFSKISQGILDTLASDATAVIENVRLLKQAREKDRLELELATAHEIQSILFPKIRGSYGYFEACAQNLPSRHISGDYYDLMRLSDESYAFVIADVSGKGVSAALLCSMVQGMLFAEAQKNGSLGECLERVNKYLVQRTHSNKFVTLFFGALSANGKLRFVNAGHNPPLVVHADGRAEELYSASVVLGAFDFAKYEENAIQLTTGDLVCLFTDGVTEARDRNGEMFGEEPLTQLLTQKRDKPTETIVETVFQSVARHSAGTMQTDDISVFILRYAPNSGTLEIRL
jgi:phosphoserine phosphatase RsbU/P